MIDALKWGYGAIYYIFNLDTSRVYLRTRSQLATDG